MGVPTLPDSLFTDRKDVFEFTDNLVLQMNFVLDICKSPDLQLKSHLLTVALSLPAESPYDQLRILQNRVLDATDEEKMEQRQKIKKYEGFSLVPSIF